MNSEKNKYKVDININYAVYKKLIFQFNTKFQKQLLIIFISFIGLFLYYLVIDRNITIWKLVVDMIFYIVLFFTFLIIICISNIKKTYKTLSKNEDNFNFSINFYDDYFEYLGKNGSRKLEYQNIRKIKNTKRYYFIYLDQHNIFPIDKNKCSSELIAFISNKVPKKSRKSKFQKQDIILTIFNPKSLLTTLLVLTTLSIPLSLMLFIVIANMINPPIKLLIKYFWIFILFLPIPITSIIFGNKYQKKGYKCKKNIIMGWIISILFVIISIPSLSLQRINYNNIYEFKSILNVDVPKNGTMYSIYYNNSNFSNHKASFVLFTVEKENNKFYQDIISNENWITEKDMDTNLFNILPAFDLECRFNFENKCLYSIYIQEIELYNLLPNEPGEYHVYAIMYNYSKKFLDIEEYQINF